MHGPPNVKCVVRSSSCQILACSC